MITWFDRVLPWLQSLNCLCLINDSNTCVDYAHHVFHSKTCLRCEKESRAMKQKHLCNCLLLSYRNFTDNNTRPRLRRISSFRKSPLHLKTYQTSGDDAVAPP